VARVIWIWLALVTTAYAQPRSDAGLVWRAPVSCPDGDEVRARVARRLGLPSDGRDDSVVHGISVEISLEGSGGRDHRFVARIDLRGVALSNEVRVLTSERCDELADAVAVVVARLAAENQQAPAALRAAPLEIALPVLSPAAPRQWGGGIRTLGISGIGALPGVGVGGELAGYLRRRSVLVELTGTRWRRNQAVRLDILALRIGWRPEELPLRAWIAGELGSVDGVNSDARGKWRGIGAGFGVAWPMSRYARLVGVIEVVAPLDRERFLLRDGAEMYRPDLVAVRSGLGLEVGWQ
jgi:hypothetical protein